MLSLAKFIKKYAVINNFFREIELRENLVGTGFIDPPLPTAEFPNRVTVVGMIYL